MKKLFNGVIFDKMNDIIVIESISDNDNNDDSFNFVFIFDGDVIGTIRLTFDSEYHEQKFDDIWGEGEALFCAYANHLLSSK